MIWILQHPLFQPGFIFEIFIIAIRKQMCEMTPTDETEDAFIQSIQALVDEYCGTGKIKMNDATHYPVEEIRASKIIGKIWNWTTGEWLGTCWLRIVYSDDDVYVHPNIRRKRKFITDEIMFR